MTDNVNHPRHYESDSGVECIEVASALPYAIGNTVKYIWRAPYKGRYDEDLRKAQWFLNQYIGECMTHRRRRSLQETLQVDLNVERAFGDVNPEDNGAFHAWQERLSSVVASLHKRGDERELFFRHLMQCDVMSMQIDIDALIRHSKEV